MKAFVHTEGSQEAPFSCLLKAQKVVKIQSKELNPVLNYSGPRGRKDRSHANIHFQHKSVFDCLGDKRVPSPSLTV